MKTADFSSSLPGLFRRLGALFYDGLLLIGILFFATAILLPFRGGQAFQGDFGYSAYLLAVVFVFFGWFWTRGGQTLGMRAWNIRLTSANGSAITWSQAALRFLPGLLCLVLFKLGTIVLPGAVKLTALLSLVLFGVSFLWALIDREKRCLHDLIAGTRMARLSEAENPLIDSKIKSMPIKGRGQSASSVK